VTRPHWEELEAADQRQQEARDRFFELCRLEESGQPVDAAEYERAEREYAEALYAANVLFWASYGITPTAEEYPYSYARLTKGVPA